MNLWDYLDRRGERALRKPPTDFRLLVGAAFLFGYYALVYALMRTTMPPDNAALVRDAFLVLGPAVGLIVGALFRSDKRDEIAANNTGEAFRAQRATAEAATAAATGVPAAPTDRPTGTPGDPLYTSDVEGTRNA